VSADPGNNVSVHRPVRDAVETSPCSADDEIRYVWATVRDHLNRCGVLIGPSAIEIRPYHPPTTLNPWYSQAKQRIISPPPSARWTTCNAASAAARSPA
jgi:hypothetical protein